MYLLARSDVPVARCLVGLAASARAITTGSLQPQTELHYTTRSAHVRPAMRSLGCAVAHLDLDMCGLFATS
jgi:hypothetical protein